MKREGDFLSLNNFGGKSKIILLLLKCSVNFPRSKLDDTSSCDIFSKSFFQLIFRNFQKIISQSCSALQDLSNDGLPNLLREKMKSQNASVTFFENTFFQIKN